MPPPIDEIGDVDTSPHRQANGGAHPRVDLHEHRSPLAVTAELDHRTTVEVHHLDEALGALGDIGVEGMLSQSTDVPPSGGHSQCDT